MYIPQDQAEDVIVINCLWCSEPGFSDKHIQEFLTRDRDDKDNPTWFFEAFADLFSCYDCVEEFHQSLNSLLSSAGNTLHLQETAYRSNVTRLSSRLREIFHGVPEVDPIEKDEYSHSRTYQLLKSHLEVPLLELLSYPRLLLNGSLCNLFVCSLKHLLRANQQIEVTKKLLGVYLLLVHPDESVSSQYGTRFICKSLIKVAAFLHADRYNVFGVFCSLDSRRVSKFISYKL